MKKIVLITVLFLTAHFSAHAMRPNQHTSKDQMIADQNAHSKQAFLITDPICSGACPLVEAAENGDLNTVQQLIQSGVAVDIREPVYLRSALMQAAFKGRLNVVNYLIQQHANVNNVDRYNNTALYLGLFPLATASVVADVLIHAGANVDIENDLGVFPLLFALCWQDVASADLLIKAGANINHVYSGLSSNSTPFLNGTTPLFQAIENNETPGMKNIVLRLINQGANIHAVDDVGQNMLFALFHNIDQTITKILIEGGVNVNQEIISTGDTAFHGFRLGFFPPQKDDDLVYFYQLAVAHGLNINHKNKDGDTYLAGGYMGNTHLPKTQLAIINSGFDVNMVNAAGDAPVNYLINIDTRDDEVNSLIDALESHGADLNHKGSDGYTLLDSAVSVGLDNTAKYILAKGVDKNSITFYRRNSAQTARGIGHYDLANYIIAYGSAGMSLPYFAPSGIALIDAVKENNLVLVKQLLANGAAVNQVDHENSTALHWAAALGLKDITQTLIAAGASTILQDDQNKTPLMWAAYNGHTEVIKLLIPTSNLNEESTIQGELRLNAFMFAVISGEPSAVEVLINANADRDVTTNYDRNALVFTAIGQLFSEENTLMKEDIFYQIINAGPIMNTGPLLLINLCARKNKEISYINALISKGIDVNWQEKSALYTALMVAAQNGRKYYVEALLAAGADKNLLSAENRNAETYARDSGFVDLANYIHNYP